MSGSGAWFNPKTKTFSKYPNRFATAAAAARPPTPRRVRPPPSRRGKKRRSDDAAADDKRMLYVEGEDPIYISSDDEMSRRPPTPRRKRKGDEDATYISSDDERAIVEVAAPAAEASAEEKPGPITRLSNELLSGIMSMLQPSDAGRFSQSSKQMNSLMPYYAEQKHKPFTFDWKSLRPHYRYSQLFEINITSRIVGNRLYTLIGGQIFGRPSEQVMVVRQVVVDGYNNVDASRILQVSLTQYKVAKFAVSNQHKIAYYMYNGRIHVGEHRRRFGDLNFFDALAWGSDGCLYFSYLFGGPIYKLNQDLTTQEIIPKQHAIERIVPLFGGTQLGLIYDDVANNAMNRMIVYDVVQKRIITEESIQAFTDGIYDANNKTMIKLIPRQGNHQEALIATMNEAFEQTLDRIDLDDADRLLAKYDIRDKDDPSVIDKSIIVYVTFNNELRAVDIVLKES